MATFANGLIGFGVQSTVQDSLKATCVFFNRMKTAIQPTDLFKIFTFKKKHYLYTNHTGLVKAIRRTT